MKNKNSNSSNMSGNRWYGEDSSFNLVPYKEYDEYDLDGFNLLRKSAPAVEDGNKDDTSKVYRKNKEDKQNKYDHKPQKDKYPKYLV